MFVVVVVFVFLRKHYFLVRFFRIHPVQSVINNPTQLSGRGFPYILLYDVVSQLCVFVVLQNGSRAVYFEHLKNMRFGKTFFLEK